MTTTDPALLKMCLHKRTYESRKLAKRMAKLTSRAAGNRHHHCDVYQCTHCGHWHVTGGLNRQRRGRDEPNVAPDTERADAEL